MLNKIFAVLPNFWKFLKALVKKLNTQGTKICLLLRMKYVWDPCENHFTIHSSLDLIGHFPSCKARTRSVPHFRPSSLQSDHEISYRKLWFPYYNSLMLEQGLTKFFNIQVQLRFWNLDQSKYKYSYLANANLKFFVLLGFKSNVLLLQCNVNDGSQLQFRKSSSSY